MGKKAARHMSALFLAVFLVGSIAGCGTDRSNLLSSETAEGLAAEIDRIDTLVAAGDCFAALDRAEGARADVAALRGEIDDRLQANLRDGLTQLLMMIQEECATDEAEPVVVEEEVDDTESGGTKPQSDDQGNQRDGGGNRPSPQPEPQPQPEPAPTPTPTPPDSGGVTPGGVSPGTGGRNG
ncbi:MAG: hypothetical protein FGM38_02470 [Solirubrobacterales bacterium]|nr:hypothetical protein [Solirubrobacterales bacterium]